MIKNLFQNLIWPAVAGNVLWALVTVLVREGGMGNEEQVGGRVFLLLALGAYLMLDWVTTGAVLDRLKVNYWVADAGLASAIVVLAIAVEQGKSWAPTALAGVFLITAIGHLSRLWESKDEALSSRRRFVLVGVNVLACGLAMVSGRWIWGPGMTLGIFAVTWFFMQKRVYVSR